MNLEHQVRLIGILYIGFSVILGFGAAGYIWKERNEIESGNLSYIY
jgi:hypothetical protein